MAGAFFNHSSHNFCTLYIYQVHIKKLHLSENALLLFRQASLNIDNPWTLKYMVKRSVISVHEVKYVMWLVQGICLHLDQCSGNLPILLAIFSDRIKCAEFSCRFNMCRNTQGFTLQIHIYTEVFYAIVYFE